MPIDPIQPIIPEAPALEPEVVAAKKAAEEPTPEPPKVRRRFEARALDLDAPVERVSGLSQTKVKLADIGLRSGDLVAWDAVSGRQVTLVDDMDEAPPVVGRFLEWAEERLQAIISTGGNP